MGELCFPCSQLPLKPEGERGVEALVLKAGEGAWVVQGWRWLDLILQGAQRQS